MGSYKIKLRNYMKKKKKAEDSKSEGDSTGEMNTSDIQIVIIYKLMNTSFHYKTLVTTVCAKYREHDKC